jgi:hypothetical protein
MKKIDERSQFNLAHFKPVGAVAFFILVLAIMVSIWFVVYFQMIHQS